METIQPTQPINIQKDLPNSNAVLVLGIISIATCWCWGIPGLVCGIIALVLASRSESEYNLDPSLYKSSSYSNMKAGKICAIIGVSISGLMFITVLIKLAFGAMLLGFLTSIIPFLDK